jgi:quercetin dioxygenase-like cupin family protein
VATAEGARIGDTDGRIRELYEGRVTEQPNKYTPGHSLVVTPDAEHRIIFETDGKVVTRFRAGRLPEVEWVERCG